jgi:hypothetical protein
VKDHTDWVADLELDAEAADRIDALIEEQCRRFGHRDMRDRFGVVRCQDCGEVAFR